MRDGYRIEQVEVAGRAAYLLTPNQPEGYHEKMPAVVALHDHGAWFSIGKEKIVRPMYDERLDSVANAVRMADAAAWKEKFYAGQSVADSLAKAGFIVLVTDALYWNQPVEEKPNEKGRIQDEGRDVARILKEVVKPHNKTLQQKQEDFYWEHLIATGEAWFETILREDKESVSYLMQVPGVDTTKIIAWGFSMGSYRAWQLAAEDKRVSACGASNWLSTQAAQGGVLTNSSSYSMYRPTLYAPNGNDSTSMVDYPDIALQIAPRPFLIQYGTDDKVISKEGCEAAIAILQNAYTKSDATQASLLSIISYPAAHRFTKQHLEDLLDWLNAVCH